MDKFDWTNIEIVRLLRNAVSECAIYKDGTEMSKTQKLFDEFLDRNKQSLLETQNKIDTYNEK